MFKWDQSKNRKILVAYVTAVMDQLSLRPTHTVNLRRAFQHVCKYVCFESSDVEKQDMYCLTFRRLMSNIVDVPHR